MSGSRIKKLLAEKERRKQMAEEGIDMLEDIRGELQAWHRQMPFLMLQQTEQNEEKLKMGYEDFIARLDIACEKLKDGPYHLEAGTCLSMQVQLLAGLGRNKEALMVCYKALALYQDEEKKGTLPNAAYDGYFKNLLEIGYSHYCQGRVQESEQDYLNVLNHPKLHLFGKHKLSCFHGLTRVYWRKKDWPNCRKYAQEGLALHKNVPKHDLQCIEPFFYIMLGNAAEGEGNWALARDFDEKGFRIFDASGEPDSNFAEGICCGRRREAVDAIKAGNTMKAVLSLAQVERMYYDCVHPTGLSFYKKIIILPAIEAVKIYVDVMNSLGPTNHARKLLADVLETEAIFKGYEEGILEEARFELQEQRRAAAAAASGGGGGGGGDGEGKKKSKAAKRKQAKRKAQQKKKAAEAAAAAGGEAKEEEQEEEEEEEEEEKDEMKVLVEETVTLTVQEEAEEECSVCLCPLEGGEERGAPLVCGHVYHINCLEFWIKKCREKCIEATCPYCRAPVQQQVEG